MAIRSVLQRSRQLGLLKFLVHLTLAAFAFSSLSAQALSQDLLANPVNRFMRSNTAPDQYSFWEHGIDFGILGNAPDEARTLALANVVFLSNVAGVPAQIVAGGDWPLQPGDAGHPANYLLFFEGNPTGSFDGVKEAVRSAGRDIVLSPDLTELLDGEPARQSDGCLMAMNATDNGNGAIAAFVGIVDSNLDAEKQRECIRSLVSFSLGVLPSLTNHELFFGQDKTRAVVTDESELILALTAIRTCYVTLNRQDGRCPASIVYNLMKSHAALVGQ